MARSTTVEEPRIIPEASFIDGLSANSLDTIELLMTFEEAFNIDIPEVDAEKMIPVNDAIDYVEKQQPA